jgi:cytochrome c-type biogenesis protein CcmH/NrfG
VKYFKLIGKYLWVFVGAVLFGIAAVKVKAAQRSENRAAEKVREYSEEMIEIKDDEINLRVNNLEAKQRRAKETRETRDDAIKKLDTISNNSGSVKSLLDEYNSERV